ncbi:hypothetical protein [Nocardioides ochotonae]|uniref:hypothetical protein n=1 Tax=Nocardioides ochotonae TaxID=2685869 RepID=UPI001408F980|nr:hypothetical protein [Nocardioides ochotonae]
MDLPTSHPAFAAHFTDAIYEDNSLETAPFGSDEGADLLQEWGERREELTRASRLTDVLGFDAGDLEELLGRLDGINQLDEVGSVRSAGFVLLRLVGHLDTPDREIVLRCLDFEITTTSDPGWLSQDARDELVPPLHQQREDLLSWENPAQ